MSSKLGAARSKSMGSPRTGLDGRQATMPIRIAEARAVRRIIEERFGGNHGATDWVICGDLNDYRQRVRIKRCCERLVQTDETVTTIGFSSGFGSSQYFARVFKKYVGVTPTAYRQLFGRGPGRAVEARA